MINWLSAAAAVVALTTGVSSAQVIVASTMPAPTKIVTRIFPIKHVEPEAVRDALQVFRYEVTADTKNSTVMVKAPLIAIPDIEDAIKRLDIAPPPSPNIELTIWLLESTNKNSQLPASLEPVALQLKKHFTFNGFRLLDTQTLRMRPGKSAEIGGNVEAGNKGTSQSAIRVEKASLASDGKSVRLDGLRYTLRNPKNAASDCQGQDIGFATDLDVEQGQKAVVGQAKLPNGQSGVLVITAKLIK